MEAFLTMALELTVPAIIAVVAYTIGYLASYNDKVWVLFFDWHDTDAEVCVFKSKSKALAVFESFCNEPSRFLITHDHDYAVNDQDDRLYLYQSYVR